jgi:hypothetical protein
VRGVACSSELKNCSSSSLAVGRTRQASSELSAKKRYHGLPCWGLGHGADHQIPQTSHVEDATKWEHPRQPSKHEIIFIDIQFKTAHVSVRRMFWVSRAGRPKHLIETKRQRSLRKSRHELGCGTRHRDYVPVLGIFLKF